MSLTATRSLNHISFFSEPQGQQGASQLRVPAEALTANEASSSVEEALGSYLPRPRVALNYLNRKWQDWT